MTQEEKELLLKDLCARLPYGLFVHTWYNKPLDIKCTGIDLYTNTINLDIPDDDNAKVYIDNCKPYLRPMSSMTEEEEVIYEQLIKDVHYKPRESTCCKLISWLNENYFDYNYLIEKGLAIAITDDNNPYKE